MGDSVMNDSGKINRLLSEQGYEFEFDICLNEHENVFNSSFLDLSQALPIFHRRLKAQYVLHLTKVFRIQSIELHLTKIFKTQKSYPKVDFLKLPLQEYPNNPNLIAEVS